MYKTQNSNLRIALMTLDEELSGHISDVAFNDSLNISIIDYSHLLSDNYDLLLLDARNLRSSKSILSNWPVPRILLTNHGSELPYNAFDFQAVLLAQEVASGLSVAIEFSLMNWTRSVETTKKLSELTYQVECRRFIIMAELMVMKWFDCTEKDAWNIIRSVAMDAQCKVEEVCIDIIAMPEKWRRNINFRYKGTVVK